MIVDVNRVLEVAPYDSQAQECKNLVASARSGSVAAFTELRDMYSQRVFNKVLSMTRNREDAEDALQDTFLQAYRALANFEERSSFYTWITRIAVNSALMILRRRRRRAEISYDSPGEAEATICRLELMDTGPSPEHICLNRQRYSYLLRSVWTLKPRLRAVMEMQMVGSYSIREMAQELGISEAAVKARLCRARAQLASARGARNSQWGATANAVSSATRHPGLGKCREVESSNAVRTA